MMLEASPAAPTTTISLGFVTSAGTRETSQLQGRPPRSPQAASRTDIVEEPGDGLQCNAEAKGEKENTVDERA